MSKSRTRVLAILTLMSLTLIGVGLWQAVVEYTRYTSIPYSRFLSLVEAGAVSELQVSSELITGEVSNPEAAGLTPYFRTVPVDDPKLVERLKTAGIEFVGTRPGRTLQLLVAWVLPLGLVGLLLYLASRKGALFGFGGKRFSAIGEQEGGIRFDDVAGCEEAKHELEEAVAFLTCKDRYQALGAQIPKGILLVGPPGTGKTLLARAVAGEAGVPFYSLSGSEFVEMFVGVGAARVRELFKEAKAAAPCIVFIDEIDAIGRARTAGGQVNDEREQTLNQLLVEMDGFEPNSGVLLLAATNRPEILDRALVRPGRFDRQVVIDAPDRSGRVAILRVHTRGKPLGPDVDLDEVARATPGFSGAELANLINEAALHAGRDQHELIGQAHLLEAVEKVLAGPRRRSRHLEQKQKVRVAYHEVGHAMVAFFCPDADPVHKITIVPRGRAALGYTLQVPQTEQFLMTEGELWDRLRTLLGGRAAEQLVYEQVSSGAENDLERATALARRMVSRFGMSPTLGLLHTGSGHSYLSPGNGDEPSCSPETAAKIEQDVQKMLSEAYNDALTILRRHRNELELVTRELLEQETLDAEEFERLLAPARAGHSGAP